MHTKEPWETRPNATGEHTIFTNDTYIGTINRHFNAEHIISCVNGCEGINPDAVKELRDVLGEIDSYCEGFFQNMEDAHFWTLHKDITKILAKAEEK